MSAPRRHPVLRTALLLAVPLSLAFVANTFFGPQTHGEQARERFEAARGSVAQGRIEEAVERLRLALQLDPSDLEIHRYYQNLLRKEGRGAEVREEYLRYRTADPRNPRSLYLHGRLLEGTEQEAAFREAVQLDATAGYAHAALGRMLYDAERYAEAINLLDQAFLLPEGRDREIGILRAKARQGTGDWDGALRAWEELAREFPELPDGWAGQAALLQRNGMHPEALRLLEEARIRAPGNPGILRAQVDSLRALGRADEADALERSIPPDPVR